MALTEGVYALLGRYYFLNNANIWLWALYGNDDLKGVETCETDKDTMELGGRYQFPVHGGEMALSVHRRSIDKSCWQQEMTTPLSCGVKTASPNLLPAYTVFENVEFPLLLLRMPEEERKKKVMDALEWLGLTDKVNSRPSQLSGGQAQRVAVARAIVRLPELVLADEPTANLDAESSHNILEMVVRLCRR